jgi:hypothetical protein
VACGNNCTLILAGAFLAPSLRHRCVEVIRSSSHLMEQLGVLEEIFLLLLL